MEDASARRLSEDHTASVAVSRQADGKGAPFIRHALIQRGTECLVAPDDVRLNAFWQKDSRRAVADPIAILPRRVIVQPDAFPLEQGLYDRLRPFGLAPVSTGGQQDFQAAPGKNEYCRGYAHSSRAIQTSSAVPSRASKASHARIGQRRIQHANPASMADVEGENQVMRRSFCSFTPQCRKLE